jgi:chromosome partitioning protein
MPTRISVTNQKGGVGKSTVAINVAGALNQRGRDVLLVDLDPQGAATEGLGFAAAYDAEPPSLFDVLTDGDQRDALPEIIVEHAEMDVVPSNIDMTAAEPELTLSRRGGEQLDLALDPVADDYDYIIVDCPPYLGYLTDNALYATQNILIPALAESTSKRALELLFDHVEALELDYEIDIRECGVIANRVEETNEAAEMLAWFDQAFPDVTVWEVRKRVALQRAFSAGGSIFASDPDLDMADVFLAIAESLDRQFDLPEPDREPEMEVSADV